MRIGFMGTKIRMDKVKSLLCDRFPEIDSMILVQESYYYEETIAEGLKELCSQLDGFLFGGRLQYELYHDVFEGVLPCGYLRKDASALKTALLKLAGRGIDVQKISIDNFSFATMKNIMEDSALSLDHLHLLKRESFKKNSHSYYESLLSQHKELYLKGETQGAVTTLSFVSEQLTRASVPCAYVIPSYDSMVRDIMQMEERITLQKSENNEQIAAILFRLSPDLNGISITQSAYAYNHQKLIAAEEIQYFAKDINALVVTQADDQYTLICRKKELMDYTRNLRSFPVLQIIWDNCWCDFQVGIGMGLNPSEAGMHAEIALRKARKQKRNGVYICYNTSQILGPMEYVKLDQQAEKENYQQLKQLAEQTGLSQNKLKQVWELAERNEEQLITVKQLAAYMKISIRVANRLMNQMEELNLVKAAGTVTTTNAGRPANVFQVLFI